MNMLGMKKNQLNVGWKIKEIVMSQSVDYKKLKKKWKKEGEIPEC